VNYQLLSIRPERHADRGHQRSAGTGPISWPPQVDMAGGQAEGAVIAVPAARDGRPNEGAAAAALERVALVRAGSRAEGHVRLRSPRP
jgi:hypothetical protein